MQAMANHELIVSPNSKQQVKVLAGKSSLLYLFSVNVYFSMHLKYSLINPINLNELHGSFGFAVVGARCAPICHR